MAKVIIEVVPRNTTDGFKWRVEENGEDFAYGTATTYREAYLEAINFARSIAEDMFRPVDCRGYVMEEMTMALRWLRAKRHIGDLLERPDITEPDDEYWKGFSAGYEMALMQLKSSHFMSDEEAAESWKMRKEMGF